jgi:hypothetical protein
MVGRCTHERRLIRSMGRMTQPLLGRAGVARGFHHEPSSHYHDQSRDSALSLRIACASLASLVTRVWGLVSAGLRFPTLKSSEAAMPDPRESGHECPICRSKTKPLDRVGDATGYDCNKHGKFKVAGTIFALDDKMNAGTERWEAALARARARHPDEWAPVIMPDDI